MNKIALIFKVGKRVFSAQDLAVIWGYSDERKLYELIKYYVKKKELFRLTRGLYSTKLYKESELRSDPQLLFEIANKLVPNSYISLFTSLKKFGLIFQYYDEVFSIADRSVTRKIKGISFIYKQIKQEALLSDLGIRNELGVRVAGAERAVVDTWYLYPQLNLDILSSVDGKKIKKIAKMYGKKKLIEKIDELERS